MYAWKTRRVRYYLRRDPDAGWSLAFWKWRIAFQVTAYREPSAARKLAALACCTVTMCAPVVALIWLLTLPPTSLTAIWWATWLLGAVVVLFGERAIYSFWFRHVAGMDIVKGWDQ